MSRPSPDPVRAGQESVWDYPRPPALRRVESHIEVRLGGRVICDAPSAWQVLETSHPPTYYLPRTAFAPGSLVPATGTSFCEWKGQASYLDLVSGDVVAPGAAWYYPRPNPAYADLVDHVALYAAATEGCFVDGERVVPQPGGFYGGWITSGVTGPFKGVPGSSGW